MQTIEYRKGKASVAEALGFWILLGAITISAVYGIGRVVEQTADETSITVRNAFEIGGLGQGATETARVSSLPDGIYVQLWSRGATARFERAYHFLRFSSVGSAVTYVGNDDARSTATWEKDKLRLDLPGERLILRRL